MSVVIEPTRRYEPASISGVYVLTQRERDVASLAPTGCFDEVAPRIVGGQARRRGYRAGVSSRVLRWARPKITVAGCRPWERKVTETAEGFSTSDGTGLRFVANR